MNGPKPRCGMNTLIGRHALVRRALTMCVVVAICGSLGVSSALGQEAGSLTVAHNDGATAQEAAWQAASWASTLPYGAAKVCLALFGGVVGGVGYVASGGDWDSASQIWRYFMTGTYVLTPSHLKGETPIHLVGHLPDGDRDEEDEGQEAEEIRAVR